MDLSRIYSLALALVDRLVVKGENKLASSLADALIVCGGSERMEAVRLALAEIKMQLSPEALDQRTRLEVSLMLNAIKKEDYHCSGLMKEIASELTSRSVEHRLIPPYGNDEPWMKYKSRFPLASWRIVDWSQVDGAKQFTASIASQLEEQFENCCTELQLNDQTVFITTSLVEANLVMSLYSLRSHSSVVFQFAGDLLVIGDNADWAFEIYHEGEGGYARAPQPLPPDWEENRRG